MHWTVALLRRDLGAFGIGLVVALVAFAAVGVLLTATIAANPRGPPVDVPPEDHEAHFQDRLESGRTPFYGIATLAGLVAFGATAAAIYGKDVQSGSVQEVLHYPRTVNQVHAAKVAVAALAGTVALVGFVLLVETPIARTSGAGWGQAAAFTARVAAAALLANVLLVVSAAGLAQVLGRLTSSLTFSFHRLYALLGLLSLIATETVLAQTIGASFLRFLDVIQTREDLKAYLALVDGVVQLSPIHAGGRVLGAMTGGTADLHLTWVVAIAAALAAAGWWLGREIYPDLFLSRLTG